MFDHHKLVLPVCLPCIREEKYFLEGNSGLGTVKISIIGIGDSELMGFLYMYIIRVYSNSFRQVGSSLIYRILMDYGLWDVFCTFQL